MLNFRAIVVTLIVAAALALPLYYYRQYLLQGMRPSTATLRLNEIEKSGFPQLSIVDLNGDEVRTDRYLGSILIVNLWATWCAPCVKELPSLTRLVKNFKGKVVVVAVSHDKSKDDLTSFLKAFGQLPEQFIVGWDPKRKTGEALGTDQLPETYVLDQKGRLVRKIVGEQIWDEPMAFRFFTELLQAEGN